METDSDSGSRRLNLIRVVRTIDNDASVPLPTRIQKLWSLINATQSTRLHGVGENILRWIFKHMSLETEDAEQVRRYPLTWSILSHIFPEIPSQTLGRLLATVRFVNILRQTVRDITTAQKKSPDQTNGTLPQKTRKRKRDDKYTSNINELRAPRGCIESATKVFGALHSLIEYHLTDVDAPGRRVGAEHIKSLFSSSNDDTRDIAAGLLLTCDRSLSIIEGGISRKQKSWVGTIVSLWNLRFHSNHDSSEFARHMYVPCCSILTRLNGDAGVTPASVESTGTKNLWVRQLEQFLSAYFIRPARRIFAPGRSLEVLETALQVSKRNLAGSAVVTWDLAARTPRDLGSPKSKAEHLLWIENVFGILLNSILTLDQSTRNKVFIQVLETAIQTASIPSTVILRTMCREHFFFTAEETDWNLVSKVIACDADVFLMNDGLLQDILDKVDSDSASDTDKRETIVTKIIIPLQEAFAKARNFSGFIRKWFDRLSGSSQDSLDQSIWFDAKIRRRLASILQSSVTSAQLLRVLESLATLDAPSGALLVVLDGISAGITEEDFINTLDPILFSTLFENRSYEGVPSSILALRWRIAGLMASWGTSEQVDRLWTKLKPVLEPILSKCDIPDPETFEAFCCCYRLRLANYPGGTHEHGVLEIMVPFYHKFNSEMEKADDTASFKPYLDFTFRYTPELSSSPQPDALLLDGVLADLFQGTGEQLIFNDSVEIDPSVKSLLHKHSFLDEDALVDALISQPLDVLDGAETQPGWTQPQSLSLVLLLLEFPREVWTKERRKRIMSSWKKWRDKVAILASQNLQYAVAVLRLLVQVMQQPTFYEGMKFDDLAYLSLSMPTNDNTVVALVERLFDLTLRQMVATIDQTHIEYLTDASNFLKTLKPNNHGYPVGQMLLAKGLVSALHQSPHKQQFHETNSTINLIDLSKKLKKMVETNLIKIGTKLSMATTDADKELLLPTLNLTFDAVACATAAIGGGTFEIHANMPASIYDSCTAGNHNMDWKLLAFLFRIKPGKYDKEWVPQLSKAPETIDEELVFDMVDAFAQKKDPATRHEVLKELVHNDQANWSIGSMLATKRLLELHQGSDASNPDQGRITRDLAIIHRVLASRLNGVESLRHFKQMTEILTLLLDKHAYAMSQFNINVTLVIVATACSPQGPSISGTRTTGEIYDKLCKLVACVLKRLRFRLRGHFPTLLGTLQRLLTVLLTDPGSTTTSAVSSQTCPPWLDARLKARHAERFTRLLTLICEPSAASVAHARSSGLDSATDAAKREAGQYMIAILEHYIKLQLEVAVPRDIKKALEPGAYSILDITSEGLRKVLNESLDANGRAIFRQMFADYKKFGKWSGV
ncbi:hypothetical protein M426DRAFT_184302 [Hypoxylon sp. CI-4A]|nr:hypothetical protein M426DRAFT_184302 [Hypoxylon sp. CI-4A]